jgi:hypothetical protein
LILQGLDCIPVCSIIFLDRNILMPAFLPSGEGIWFWDLFMCFVRLFSFATSITRVVWDGRLDSYSWDYIEQGHHDLVTDLIIYVILNQLSQERIQSALQEIQKKRN